MKDFKFNDGAKYLSIAKSRREVGNEQNLELSPVQVKGTNLRNSLIVCGVAIACYLMFFKKKKRG